MTLEGMDRYIATVTTITGEIMKRECSNKKTALAWARKLKAKELVIQAKNGQVLVHYKKGK